MDLQLAVILALTFVIHLIGTVAYAFRIAAVRTGHIAIAFSLFNILVLISRTSNSFQGPFIAKRVELAIADAAASQSLFADFRIIMLAATAATLAGGLLIPTLQRYASRAVTSFKRDRSVVRLLGRSLTRPGIAVMKESLAFPGFRQLRHLRLGKDIPYSILISNIMANALWSVGVLASIYAGFLFPEFRVTASSLSAIVNGFATIALFIFIDPYLSGLTDDAVQQKGDEAGSEGLFRRVVIWMILTKLAGTIVAQLLFVPSAYLIAAVAHWI